MPSFLNKVFGYKKHDDKETARPAREASEGTLLDGKYEAILPVTSPSASTFAEAHSSRDPDRDVGFSLFRPRTRGLYQKPAQKRVEDVPRLALHLPGPKENSDSRAFGVVFEADPDSQIVLDDAIIAAKRLSPLEALILVRACAQAIAERGLETLGIMHPHWFSASADVQRKLISLFIRSLTQTRITTLSPTPASSSSAFENELQCTRSPHDVAAVLRWGLRHLSLENGHFGKDSVEWGWYNAFFQAERNASYPPRGFSELLVPHLPTSHEELLTTTLNLISSLASHAEANSISGSKLSKFLGLWLLVATRAERSDDWNQFYARWERSGRILEHLFLARLRDESVGQRLPTRLQELVKYYPYNRGALATNDDLLPRPRFSTRQYDALFVRVDTLLAHSAEQPKQHPIQLLLEAFQLPIDDPSGDELIALWNTLKTTVFAEADSSDPEGPQFSRIFVDETIHLLSLIPAGNNTPTSPTFLASPITPVVSREPASISKALERAISRPSANNASTPATPTSPSSFVITDWAQFTLSGFGDAPTTQPLASPTSQDDDIEVTRPPSTRKSSRHRGKSHTRRRRSEEDEPSDTSLRPNSEPSVIETKLASVRVVQIDEAFIDFWSDAIVEPISANWPTFVVCGLKQISSVQQAISWLIIEQGYSRQEPQPSRVPSPDGRRGRSPRPSFKSDISGFRINSVFASARKRFSIFNKSATDLDVRKSGGKTLVAGEFGEALVEEDPTPSQTGVRVDGNGAVRAAATSGATTDVADQLKADQTSTPIAGISSALVVNGEPTPVRVAAEAPSIEPTPQFIDGHNKSGSVLPPPLAKPLDETISVERESSHAFDVVNLKGGSSSASVTKIAPLSADTSDVRPTQGIYNRAAPASEPSPSVENAVAQEVWQVDAVEVEKRPVEPVLQITDRDKRLHAEPMGKPSPRAPEVVALAAIVPIVAADAVNQAPKPTVQESHVAEQPPQTVFADPATAFPIKSVDAHEIDDLSPVPATGAQLEQRLATPVADKVEDAKDVAGPAGIPTPALERVALVEETPGQEGFADGHAGAAQVSAIKPGALDQAATFHEVIDDAASQPVAAELQATLALEGEASSLARPVEASSVEVVPAANTSLEATVVETHHAPDQVPEVAVVDTHAHVQDAIVPTTGKPETLFHEDRIDETLDAETSAPIPEPRESVDETLGYDAHEPVEAAPAIAPEFVVEAGTREPVVGTVVEVIPLAEEEAQPFSETELPTQVHDVQAADILSTRPNPEAKIAALATTDEAVAVKAETQPAPDVSTEGAESVPVADTLEVATEAVEPPPSTATEPEPVAGEEAQVLVLDATPVASESVAIIPIVTIIHDSATHDVSAPMEIDYDQPSSAPTPQSVDDDDRGRLPIVGVAASVPEEIVVAEADAQGELKVVPPTVETVDKPQVAEDAEPEALAAEPTVAEIGAPDPLESAQGTVEAAQDVAASQPEVAPTVEVNETAKVDIEVVVVNDGERVALVVEPASEVNVPTPTVEDAPVPMEAEEPTPVEAPEDIAASQSEVAPTVEANETAKVDIEEAVVNDGEPVALAVEPAMVEDSVPTPGVEGAPAPVDSEESTPVEAPKDVTESQPVAPVETEESTPAPVEASEDVAASQSEVALMVEVNDTAKVEVRVVVVDDGEYVALAVEPAVVEVSVLGPVDENVPAPADSESTSVEAPEDINESVASVEAESTLVPVEASEDVATSQSEVAPMVEVHETAKVEIELVVVDDGERVALAAGPAVVEDSVPAPVDEVALVPVDSEESVPVSKASEDIALSQLKVQVKEVTKVDEPQQAVDHSEPAVPSESNVSINVPAAHSGEIAPVAS